MMPTATSFTAPEAAGLLLRRARQRHHWLTVASVACVAGATAWLLVAAYGRWPQLLPLLAGIGTAGLTLLVAVLWPLRRADTAWAIRRFDRYFPELEDSTGLLLASPDGLLAQLQQQRVAERLAQLPLAEALPVPWRGRLLLAVLLAGIGGVLWLLPRPVAPVAARTLQPHFPQPATQPITPAAPRLLSTQVRIEPPAYTRLPATPAPQLSFRCPQGSVVRWTLRLSRPPEAAPQLLVAGQPPVAFRAVADQPTAYVAEYRFTRSALYRLRVAGQTSDDYAVDAQPDATPTLRLLAPPAYTLIKRTQPPVLTVRTDLRDDYGLTRARLVVTTAQGTGEAVKFREVVTDLSAGLRQQPRQHRTATTLRLPALGLTYGDELYVYAEAWDAAGHRSRTDAALVQWQDTAATADDAAAISLGVNQMPAYFRSQRQIIIDTEKLLARRRQLSAAEFRAQANSLGDDQKVLRLRYGKFLGEEGSHTMTAAAEEALPIAGEEPTEPQHHDDDGHDHHAPAAESGGMPTAEDLLTPYQHLHDDAETADFLEPQVKAKLRAVLSQMWEAELRLRLAQPAEARPYEYRALRLLKQVQQQTRLYVRKSGVELPPLPEAEKRLSGDLSTAAAPRRQGQQAPTETQSAIRRALTLLATYRAGRLPVAADLPQLQPAGQELGTAALREPGRALSALRAWRRLLAQVQAARPVAPADLDAVERALTALLPAPTPAAQRPALPSLARRYFQQLSR